MPIVTLFSCSDINAVTQWLDIHAWRILDEHLPDTLLQQLLADEPLEMGLQLDIRPDVTAEQSALLQQIHQYWQAQPLGAAWLSFPLLRLQRDEQWRLIPAAAWRVDIEAGEQPFHYVLRYKKGDWFANEQLKEAYGIEVLVQTTIEKQLEAWASAFGVNTLSELSLTAAPSHGSTEYQAAYLPSLLLLPCNINTSFEQEVQVNADAPVQTEAATATQNDGTTPEKTDVPPTQPQHAYTLSLAKAGKPWKTAIAALPLSSEQHYAAYQLYQGKSLVIAGSSKTGKTHWLASVLPSIWLEGGNAMVVLPQGTAANDLQYHLEQLGLKDIGILTLLESDDLEKDRLLSFLDKLPQLTKNTLDTKQEISYKKQLHSYHRYRSELDAISKHLQTEVVEGQHWVDVVGLFLLRNQKTGKHLIRRVLSEDNFLFSEAEYLAIQEEVSRHKTFFDAVGTLEHPLNLLHDTVFGADVTTAKQNINAFLEKHQKRGSELLNLYLALLEDYAYSLQSGYDDYADALRRQAESVLYAVELYLDIYGENMGRSGAMLRVMGIFSGHHRDVLAAKDVLYQSYQRLEEAYTQYKYFEAKLPNIRQTPLPEVADKLKSFLVELERWQQRTPRWVEQKMQEWTTALPIKIEYKRQLEDAERQLQQWFAEMQQESILQRVFSCKEPKVLRRPDVIREALAYLHETGRQMHDFNAFFAWRGHWLGLSERSQKVVYALVNARINDWTSAFEAWYLHQLLTRKAGVYHSERNLPLKEFVDNFKLLRTSLAQHALNTCRHEQAAILQQWRKEGKQWRAAYQAQSLTDLLKGIGLQALRKVFPLIVATPEKAKMLAEMSLSAWDLVALESAHNIDATAVTAINAAATQLCILGLPATETPSAAGSLMVQSQRQAGFFRLCNFSTPYSKDAKSNAYPVQTPLESNFRQAVHNYLAAYISPERLEMNVLCEGVLADIVIKPLYKNAAPIAVLCDGWCKAPTWSDYEWALHQRTVLEANGYVLRYAWSDEWWRNPEKSLQAVVAFVVHWDRQYLPRQ